MASESFLLQVATPPNFPRLPSTSRTFLQLKVTAYILSKTFSSTQATNERHLLRNTIRETTQTRLYNATFRCTLNHLLTAHTYITWKCPDMRGKRIRESDTKCLGIVQCTIVPSDFPPDCGGPVKVRSVKRGWGMGLIVLEYTSISTLSVSN